MPFPTNRLLRSRRRVGDCIHALVTLFVHPYHAVDVSPVTEGCDDPFVLHQTCFMIRRRNRAPAVPDWHGGGALPDAVANPNCDASKVVRRDEYGEKQTIGRLPRGVASPRFGRW